MSPRPRTARRARKGVPADERTVAPAVPLWLLVLALTLVTFLAYRPAWHGGAALGRRRAPDPSRAAVARRPRAHLARARGDAAVLPAHPHRLLAPAPALGRRHVRVPPRQHLASPRHRPASPRDPPDPADQGRVPGRRRLRPPPRPRRIGRLDHRAEEHPGGSALRRRGAGVSPVRRHAAGNGPGPRPWRSSCSG